MEALKNIPVPAANDRETVATALETAAVFEKNGNAEEALRWLKRAAQSAGEVGDDVRALALAHAAAELSSWVQQRGPSMAAPARRPPPLPKAPPNGAHTEPPPSATRSTPSRSAAASQLATRPPAPSSRPAPARAAASLPVGSAAAAPRVRERLGSSRPSAAAAPRQAARGTPEAAPAGKPKQQETASASSQTRAVEAAASVSLAANADADSVNSLPGGAEQSSVRTIQRSIDVPTLRQTARVAVVPSNTERGLFLVRFLAEGEAPPEHASEALLTLMDPKTSVFKR